MNRPDLEGTDASIEAIRQFLVDSLSKVKSEDETFGVAPMGYRNTLKIIDYALELEARVQELEAGLAIFADEKNWSSHPGSCPDCGVGVFFPGDELVAEYPFAYDLAQEILAGTWEP